MSWRTRLALRLLRKDGHDVAIELRAVRHNAGRPGVIGKKLETFGSVRAGLAALARQVVLKPDVTLVLSVRASIATKALDRDDAPEATEEQLKNAVVRKNLQPVEPETTAESGARHTEPELPGNQDLDEPEGLMIVDESSAVTPAMFERPLPPLVPGACPCDRDGPLVPIDGEYQQTCSKCGAPQGLP